MIAPYASPIKAKSFIPNVAKNWTGRMYSLGYYGDDPGDVVPEMAPPRDTPEYTTASESFMTDATGFINSLTPAISSTRQAIQAVRGKGTPLPVKPVTHTGVPSWLIYGLGAVALAGGAYYFIKKR